MKTDMCTFVIISRWIPLRMTNVSDKSCTKKFRTHILCSTTIFWRSCPLWNNTDEYCRAGQATDDIMAHAHCKAGYLRPQTCSQNMWHLLLFHCNNGYTNTSQCHMHIGCLAEIQEATQLQHDTQITIEFNIYFALFLMFVFVCKLG